MSFKKDMPQTAGQFRPYMKYDAKAGRLFRQERFKDAAGAWVNDPKDITADAQFICDFLNLEVGFMSYSPPAFIMAKHRDIETGVAKWPVDPGGLDGNGKPLFKVGFRLPVKLAVHCGGDIRDFGSSAVIVNDAMDALHKIYEEAPEANLGKLPIVALTGTEPRQSANGTNYFPVMSITGWVDRPDDLPLETASPQTTTSEPTEPQQQAAKVDAPPPASSSEPVFN